jgi:diguanylate cyclase (GGDEF)-like protein
VLWGCYIEASGFGALSRVPGPDDTFPSRGYFLSTEEFDHKAEGDYSAESAGLEEIRLWYERRIEEAEGVSRANEQAFRNVKAVRHKIIGARSLSELVETLVTELRRLRVHHVTLSLSEDQAGPDRELLDGLAPELEGSVLVLSRSALEEVFDRQGGIVSRIGERELVDRLGLFGQDIRSCAIIPLEYRGALIGSLNLGSRSTARFAADRSTDLLDDLAVTAALCLDNVITHQRNERLASTDPLTGVHNRRFFFETAARLFDLSRRHGDVLSCLYIDLDEFKPINDLYGHEAGDLALKRLAETVQGRMRRTDVFARLGGDEFALLLPRTTADEAALLAADLKRCVAEISFRDVGLDEMVLKASIGVASMVPDDASLEAFIGRADQAMYEAKKTGKGS